MQYVCLIVTINMQVVFNYWNPGNDPNALVRTKANWDTEYTVSSEINSTDITEIHIKGGMNIYFANFTEDKCLALSANGLVVPMNGPDCALSKKTVCEFQSCYTKEGNECIFPFTYKEVVHQKCISDDVYQPWCATKIFNGTTNIEKWGLCLDDCVREEPLPSCLSPPTVPMFGIRNSSMHPQFENYASNWFALSFLNNLVFMNL